MASIRRRVEEAALGALERDSSGRPLAGGMQLYVSIGGEIVADMAVGDASEGRSMTPRHVFNLTCALKPVLALAVVLEIQAGRLSLEDPIDTWLPETSARRGSLLVSHLLTHTSGLPDPEPEVIRQGEEAVCRAALSARYPPGWVPGVRTQYTAVVDWQLLGMLLNVATHERTATRVRRLLCAQLQMQDTHLVLPGSDAIDGDLLGFHYAAPFGWSGSVLLDGVPPEHCVPSSTGIGTMRDLGRLYEMAAGLVDCDDRLRTAFDTMRGTTLSPSFPAMPSYGLGFAVDLSLHYISPRLSVDSFGHGGRAGAILGMADPRSEFVIALLFNSSLDAGRSVLRRRAVIDAVMWATGLGRPKRRVTAGFSR